MPVTPDRAVSETPRLGLRAYARHRGCALSTVQQAIREGRITRGADGKIEPAEADRDWLKNTRSPVTEDIVDPEIAKAAAELGIDLTLSFSDARTFKERYLGALRKLEYDTKRGALIDRVEVERAQFAIARKVRDVILAIPDRLAEQISAETDPRKVYEILQTELRQALHAVADAIETEAAAD